MASVKDLYFWGLDLGTARHISHKDYELLVRQGCKPLVGDVLIAKDGNSALDTVCVIEKPIDVVLLSSVAILRPDSRQIEAKFLKYYFMSPTIIQYLKSNFISGAAIPRVILRDFKQAEILLPRLSEQKAIAHILGSLDDKIELNRRMNATLESMAQALFKSWFVDFDPVIDNALAAGHPIPEPLQYRAEARSALGDQRKPLPEAIQQQFPDRFVFNEDMGWVPEGWAVKSIGDIVKRLSVGKKFSQKTASESGIVPILDQGKSGIIGFHNEKPGVIASPDDPIIVFANHTCYMRLIMYNFSAIQNVLPLKGKTTNIYWTYFATLGKQPFIEYKGHWPDFVMHNVVIPQQGLDNIFGKEVSPYIRSVHGKDMQNESLATLRDTLLPKLLSGQMRIREAEKQVAEVL